MFKTSEHLIPFLLEKIVTWLPTSDDKMFILGSYPSSLFDNEKNVRQAKDIDLFVYTKSSDEVANMFA